MLPLLLFLLLAQTFALDVQVASTCPAGYVEVASLYSTTNSHLGAPGYYGNKLCVRSDFLKRAGIKPVSELSSNESAVLYTYKQNNTHVSFSYLPNYALYFSCPVSVALRSSCEENETCLLELYKTSNSHVATCENNLPYKLCIRYEAEMNRGTCECAGYEWIERNACCNENSTIAGVSKRSLSFGFDFDDEADALYSYGRITKLSSNCGISTGTEGKSIKLYSCSAGGRDLSYSEPFTLTLWVLPTYLEKNERTMSIYSGNSELISLNITPEKKAIFCFNSACCELNIKTGYWNFLAFTFNGSTLRCYSNMQEEKSVSSSSSGIAKVNLTLSSERNYVYLDELFLFSRLLSRAELIEMLRQGKKTISSLQYISFDECPNETSSFAKDYSPNNNSLELYNVLSTTGFEGCGIRTNSSSDSYFEGVYVGNDGTALARIKFHSCNAELCYLLGFGNIGNFYGLGIKRVGSIHKLLAITGNSYEIINTNLTLADNAWHLTGVSFNSSALRIFVDKWLVFEKDASVSGALSGGFYVNASFDDVEILNFSISSEQEFRALGEGIFRYACLFGQEKECSSVTCESFNNYYCISYWGRVGDASDYCEDACLSDNGVWLGLGDELNCCNPGKPESFCVISNGEAKQCWKGVLYSCSYWCDALRFGCSPELDNDCIATGNCSDYECECKLGNNIPCKSDEECLSGNCVAYAYAPAPQYQGNMSSGGEPIPSYAGVCCAPGDCAYDSNGDGFIDKCAKNDSMLVDADFDGDVDYCLNGVWYECKEYQGMLAVNCSCISGGFAVDLNGDLIPDTCRSSADDLSCGVVCDIDSNLENLEIIDKNKLCSPLAGVCAKLWENVSFSGNTSLYCVSLNLSTPCDEELSCLFSIEKNSTCELLYLNTSELISPLTLPDINQTQADGIWSCETPSSGPFYLFIFAKVDENSLYWINMSCNDCYFNISVNGVEQYFGNESKIRVRLGKGINAILIFVNRSSGSFSASFGFNTTWAKGKFITYPDEKHACVFPNFTYGRNFVHLACTSKAVPYSCGFQKAPVLISAEIERIEVPRAIPEQSFASKVYLKNTGNLKALFTVNFSIVNESSILFTASKSFFVEPNSTKSFEFSFTPLCNWVKPTWITKRNYTELEVRAGFNFSSFESNSSLAFLELYQCFSSENCSNCCPSQNFWCLSKNCNCSYGVCCNIGEHFENGACCALSDRCCLSDVDCGSGYYCENNTPGIDFINQSFACRAKKDFGFACYESRECLSEWCGSGFCTLKEPPKLVELYECHPLNNEICDYEAYGEGVKGCSNSSSCSSGYYCYLPYHQCIACPKGNDDAAKDGYCPDVACYGLDKDCCLSDDDCEQGYCELNTCKTCKEGKDFYCPSEKCLGIDEDCCLSDEDCMQGERCVNNVCIGNLGDTCISDADCSQGMICKDNKCVIADFLILDKNYLELKLGEERRISVVVVSPVAEDGNYIIKTLPPWADVEGREAISFWLGKNDVRKFELRVRGLEVGEYSIPVLVASERYKDIFVQEYIVLKVLPKQVKQFKSAPWFNGLALLALAAFIVKTYK